METKTFQVLSAQSNIEWTGRKVTGAHNGTISVKSGSLVLVDDKLCGGDFVIDMPSIKILDIEDQDLNAQFAGHLFSDDFFAVDHFPEAFFTIIDVAQKAPGNLLITGTLTIKDISHPVTFPANVLFQGNVMTATGKIVVDRTLYDMRFRSSNFFANLGDTLIYNEFELDVRLTAFATL